MEYSIRRFFFFALQKPSVSFTRFQMSLHFKGRWHQNDCSIKSFFLKKKYEGTGHSTEFPPFILHALILGLHCSLI